MVLISKGDDLEERFLEKTGLKTLYEYNAGLTVGYVGLKKFWNVGRYVDSSDDVAGTNLILLQIMDPEKRELLLLASGSTIRRRNQIESTTTKQFCLITVMCHWLILYILSQVQSTQRVTSILNYSQKVFR